jgi:phytoene dehydrogenase-like protein
MSSTAGTPYDVIFIGAGHNALVAEAYLTRAGRRVCLLERSDVPGGWVRSEELTLPGFVHDTYSALHPSFGSPNSAPNWPDAACATSRDRSRRDSRSRTGAAR